MASISDDDMRNTMSVVMGSRKTSGFNDSTNSHSIIESAEKIENLILRLNDVCCAGSERASIVWLLSMNDPAMFEGSASFVSVAIRNSLIKEAGTKMEIKKDF